MEPHKYSTLWYAVFGVLVMWGYITDYLRQVKAGSIRPTLRAFLLDLPAAYLAGFVSLSVCQNYHVGQELTAGIVAMAGYIGGKGIAYLEQLVFKAGDRYAGRNK